MKLTVILGLGLFLPAGTLDYWQGWVYLILFVGSSGVITAVLLKSAPKLVESRLKAGPTAEKEFRQKIIQAFASVFYVLYAIVPALDRRFGWSDVPAYLVVAGDVFIVLGFWMMFRVFRENSFAASTIQMMEGQTVISTGPYRVVRHPMYAGALVMLLPSPLALGSYWGLWVDLPMLGVIVWRLLEEEKFLLKNLPDYEEYRRKTRYRLVPFVW